MLPLTDDPPIIFPMRKLASALIIISLSISACSPEKSNPIPPSSPTPPAATQTSPPKPANKTAVPICFTPKELLPFAFSANSDRLALRNNQGVQFFDLVTGQEVATLTAPGMVISAALSPDGSTIAWSLADNSIQLVQVPDGTVLHSLTAHPDPVFDLRFSPSTTRLYSASHDGTVRVWDTATGKLMQTIEIGLEVLGIGVSPDGNTLAVVPAYGPVQLWELDTKQQTSNLGGTGGYDTSDPAFSPDGKYLAVDLATGIFIWTLPAGRGIWSGVANSMAVAYSPDGNYLAYSDIDESNQMFLGPANAQGDFRIIDEMQGPVWELFFSADSTLLAASDGIEVRVWHLPDGERILVGRASCN